MTGYVLGFAFSPSREFVLLIRKQKPAWQAGMLNGIGGKIEPDETSLSAMHREAQEECAVVADWQHFARLCGDDWCVECYRAFNVTEFRECEAEEPLWCPVNALTLDVISNLRWLIPLALDSSPVTQYRVTATIEATNDT